MQRPFTDWKTTLDRLCTGSSADWSAIAEAIAEIADDSPNLTLRQAATQALPLLRNATLKTADRITIDAAQRRLDRVREVLNELTAPRFGRRGISAPVLTAEQRQRKILGLPLEGRLSATEIHQAYKRLAKSVHPDAGGDKQAFLDLAAAREALIRSK